MTTESVRDCRGRSAGEEEQDGAAVVACGDSAPLLAAGEPVLDPMVQARACFLTENPALFLLGIKKA
jgi:hypothetical protein